MKDKGFFSYSTGKQFLENVSIVFYGAILLPMLFFGYLYLELFYGSFEALLPAAHHALVGGVSVPIIALCCGLALGKAWQQRKQFHQAKLFRAELDRYRRLILQQHFLFVAGAVVTELAMALTAAKYYAAIFVIIALILVPINRPTAMKLARDFRLTREQSDRLMEQEVTD